MTGQTPLSGSANPSVTQRFRYRYADTIRTLTSQIENIGDPRYVRALGHPLRVRILAILEERTASAVELSRMLQADIGVVAYHVRKLHQLGLIELERETRVRGAIQRHYRAYERPRVSDDAWEQAPPVAKQAAVDAALQQIYDYGRASNAAGGFDRRDAHITRTALRLDAEGWERLAALAAARARGRRRDRGDVAAREAAGEAEGIEDVGLVLMQFEALPFSAGPAPAPRRRLEPRPEPREQRVVELVAVAEHALQLRERRARRVRARGEPHVVADQPHRERAPAVARARRGVQREHVERHRVAGLQRPAEDRRTRRGRPRRRAPPRTCPPRTRARGRRRTSAACTTCPTRASRATNSSVLSRGTGSSGIQNETVSEPSML